MSEPEEFVIMQEAGVKKHDSESPPSFGLKAGAFANLGTLILTSRRLIYVQKGGAARSAAWALGGALAARGMEKMASQAEIDDVARCEGSFFVPLREIVRVETGRKLGNAFLRVANCSPGQKPVHCYIFGSGISRNDEWVNAINKAILQAKFGQNAQASPQDMQPQTGYVPIPPPPPPSNTATPSCPYCHGPLAYIPEYQRWYCYRDQRYV